jgi:DNA polymerase IV
MSEYRKIIHVDMDCFFAAVEFLDHPELKGKPLAVGHDAERGVVSTASYEARKFGVHSALSMVVAKRLCPQLVIMPPRMERYKQVSQQIHEIFSRYTDLIEPISIDEAFLDVTNNKPGIPLAKDVAMEIKAAISNELHLTASAGVSYCKMLAKIASDYNKPDGLCVIHPQRAISFLDNLRLEKLWLVGPKTARDMNSVGIFTVRQLRACSLTTLTRLFGKRGQMFYNFSRGIDDSEVQVEHERKSVSCEATFENDIWKRSAVIIELYHIVLELMVRLSKNDFQGRTLTLKVKFSDFTTVTRSITADKPLVRKNDILPLAKKLLGRVSFSHDHPIRLIGLGVGRADEATMPRPTWVEQDLPFDEW